MLNFNFTASEHKKILAIALPMILSNITVPLLGLVDTAVIGHLDSADYLAGVAVGAMITSFLFWSVGFLRMSTTGLIAQAHGAQSVDKIVTHLRHSLVIVAVLSLIIVCLQSPIRHLALLVVGASEPVNVFAAHYFDVRIWSTPAVLANLVIIGCLLGMQNAKWPMILLIVSNILNIILDFVFVFGFDWKVEGVAAASVIADYTALIIGLYALQLVLKKHGYQLPVFSLKLLLDSPKKYLVTLALNRDIFIRSLCLQLCFVFMTSVGARLGDNIVAANAILMNFFLLISYGLDGFAYSAEALVGKAFGEKNGKMIHRYTVLCLGWSFAVSTLFAFSFWLFEAPLLHIMTDIPSVINVAKEYYAWVIFLPIAGVWCFLFDGVFIGLTRGKDMRNSMIFSTLIGFYFVWFLAKGLGNHGLWLALTSFMLFRGFTLAGRYYQLHLNRSLTD